MKFVLFVEGHTESKAIPAFLKRWLDGKLSQKVGIDPVRFEGWSEMIRDLPDKTCRHLRSPGASEIIAVIALLDLYGPTFYPAERTSAEDRLEWATKDLQKKVNQTRFRVFFAVHEVEAWLLSKPDLFPSPIRQVLPNKIQHPESVNFDEPPAKLLQRLYVNRLGRNYRKVTDGSQLFGKLSPDDVYAKCPNFRDMMDQMLELARAAGL